MHYDKKLCETCFLATHPRVVNGRPFPLGPHVEMLVLDDRVGLCAVPRGSPVLPAMDYSFERGSELLRAAGLQPHAEKRRGSAHASPLGLEIRGALGLGEAERMRRANLFNITLGIVIAVVVVDFVSFALSLMS